MIDLKEFVGETIVAREVERKDRKHTFYFAEISAEEAEDLFLGVSQTDAKKNKGLRARIISAVVRDEKGGKAFTEKEANALPLWLANKLQEIALEVNALTEDKDAKKE
jgi:hypothetical protein